MRIVCEKCQAKYFISDDKIVSRTVRLTCRKCGEVITMRVDEDASGAEKQSKWKTSAINTPRKANAETPGWYYSHNGESFGPFTPEELIEKIQSPQVNPVAEQCYVWHRSLGAWKPLVQVEPFSTAIQTPPPPPKMAAPFTAPVSSFNSQQNAKISSPNVKALKSRLLGRPLSARLDDQRLDSKTETLTGIPPLVAEEVPTHPAIPVAEDGRVNSRDESACGVLTIEPEVSSDESTRMTNHPFRQGQSFQSLDAVPDLRLEINGQQERVKKPFPSVSALKPIPKSNSSSSFEPPKRIEAFKPATSASPGIASLFGSKPATPMALSPVSAALKAPVKPAPLGSPSLISLLKKPSSPSTGLGSVDSLKPAQTRLAEVLASTTPNIGVTDSTELPTVEISNSSVSPVVDDMTDAKQELDEALKFETPKIGLDKIDRPSLGLKLLAENSLVQSGNSVDLSAIDLDIDEASVGDMPEVSAGVADQPVVENASKAVTSVTAENKVVNALATAVTAENKVISANTPSVTAENKVVNALTMAVTADNNVVNVENEADNASELEAIDLDDEANELNAADDGASSGAETNEVTVGSTTDASQASADQVDEASESAELLGAIDLEEEHLESASNEAEIASVAALDVAEPLQTADKNGMAATDAEDSLLSEIEQQNKLDQKKRSMKIGVVVIILIAIIAILYFVMSKNDSQHAAPSNDRGFEQAKIVGPGGTKLDTSAVKRVAQTTDEPVDIEVIAAEPAAAPAKKPSRRATRSPLNEGADAVEVPNDSPALPNVPDRAEVGWKSIKPSLDACQRRLMKTQDNQEGKITLKVDVAADGSVTRFDMTPKTSEPLMNCLKSKQASWQFGAGDTISVSRTFTY